MSFGIFNPYTNLWWTKDQDLETYETRAEAIAAKKRAQAAWKLEFGTEIGDDEAVVRSTKNLITRENFDEGAYRRGVSWEVFSTGGGEHHDDYEIQRIDVVEHEDVHGDLTAGPAARDNPWFEDDLEAELMVCFLALDGDRKARKALREIGCTKRDVPWL